MPNDLPQLTPAQRRYLWLRATGSTDGEARQIMKTGPHAYSIATHMKEHMGAKTIEHAVFLACQLDMIGEREECGTMPGIRRHQNAREDLCRACRRLNAEYAEAENKGYYDRPPVLSAVERQLLDLLESNLTRIEINTKLNRTEYAMKAHRTSLYRKLGVNNGSHATRRVRAVHRAREFGLLAADCLPDIFLERRAEPVREIPKLTDLEVRTLAVLADGTSLTKAAKILNLPASTSITGRLANIYRKLDVVHLPRTEKRAAAVAKARDLGYAV